MVVLLDCLVVVELYDELVLWFVGISLKRLR